MGPWAEASHLAHESGSEGIGQFLAWLQGSHPDRYHEIRKAIEVAEEAPDEEEPEDSQRPLGRTDLGNARRLVKLFGDRIRFHTAWKVWLIWDGRRWREDHNGQIVRLAKKVVAAIYKEASDSRDDATREALAKWAISSESRAHIEAMIALAQTELGIPITPDCFDTQPMLFNVLNGTIDLRTGVLGPHRREDLITKLAPVRYDPEATCPLWDEFLDLFLRQNREMIEFVQRASGYAMTADTSEQCLFFLYGSGGNGKSTFLSTLETTFGDFAITVDPKILASKDHDEHPTELCDLDGPRLVSTVEVEDAKRLAESLVKRLTGGMDKIRARRMRRDPYQFEPKFKLFIAGNHKPIIRNSDHGIWRRIRMLPFDYQIPEDQKIQGYEKLLLAEKSGILNWLLRGCLEWQRQRLNPPGIVLAATEDYRREMDDLQDFIDECCVAEPGNQQYRCNFKDLWKRYERYCDDNGIKHPFSKKKLGLELEARGFTKTERNGATIRWGLAIRSDAPQEKSSGAEIDDRH